MNYLTLSSAVLSCVFFILTEPARAVPDRVCGEFFDSKTEKVITRQLQTLIDTCSKNNGGKIILHAGTYQSGPIQLRSHIELHLEADSLLQAIGDHSLYRAAYINWPWSPSEAFISLAHVNDVALTGSGTIDGNGESWWDAAIQEKKAGNTNIAHDIPRSNGLPRPWLIESYDSRKISLSDFHVTRSPMWNIVLRYTDNATLKKLSITNPSKSPNTDGIDIITSKNISVLNSFISTGDDDIAIKSGLPGTLLPKTLTHNIYINNISIKSGHGLSVGSETIFSIQDVFVKNIKFDGTTNGIRIKSGRDRGSILKHYNFDTIYMQHVRTGISISAYYPHSPDKNDSSLPVTLTTPRISDINISNLEEHDVKNPGVFLGLPEMPLKNITLNCVKLDKNTPLKLKYASLYIATVSKKPNCNFSISLDD